jgi:hypothetical protein
MHEANQPYNVLDGAGLQKDGRSANSLARLNTYENVLRSYCQKGDPICANGTDINQHLNYFELYADDAAAWAVGKIDGTAPLCAVPTPTPSASSSAVASSSVAASSVAAASVPSSSAMASSAAASSVAASSVVVAASSVVVAASSVVVAAFPSGAASYSVAAPPSPVAPAPTSKVTPAPFPAWQSYEQQCVPIIKIEYVYV